jgi:hypothetical protein
MRIRSLFWSKSSGASCSSGYLSRSKSNGEGKYGRFGREMKEVRRRTREWKAFNSSGEGYEKLEVEKVESKREVEIWSCPDVSIPPFRDCCLLLFDYSLE